VVAQIIDSLVREACKNSLGAYFSSYATIKQKGGAFCEGLPMHEYQHKLGEVQSWCAQHGIPCRIVALKPRRGGSSTFAMASMHHFLTWTPGRTGCVMGGSDYQGENLFAMLRLMAHSDRIVTKKAVVLDKNARYPNGSTAVRINASNENAGLSGGYDFMVVTELAKWQDDGVAAAPDVLAGALKCVPFLPGTTVIIESTAEGVGNEFHRIYSTSISFEELKAGKTGYVRVFSPWFEFSDHVLSPEQMGIAGPESLTADELEIIARYQLRPDQVSWMRYTIKDQCKGDFENFRENYPFDDVSCFLLSGRKAFSARGLAKMKYDAQHIPYSTGTLDYLTGSKEYAVVWRPGPPSECRILRWEPPREGMKYLVSVDSMTGASQTVGADPDNHFAVVWRAGYFDRGAWCAPRIVAHSVDHFESWLTTRKLDVKWDIDVMEAQVWRLATYYGNCLIVPEMNKDRGLVELLKLRLTANIYVRTHFNRREQTETNMLGWVTTPETRGKLVTALQIGIREYANIDPVKGPSQERCEIYSPVILDEAETFIIKSDGRCEAMAGKHDDGVLASGIGLACIDAATTYHQPAGHRRESWDVAEPRPNGNSTYS
jgi:hypothetical protein